MGNSEYEAIKAALTAHGLSLRKVDGKWETVEKPGGPSGLPVKLHEIKLKFVGKPGGSPGRGESSGYNLQSTIAMSDGDYNLVHADAKVVLHHTNGINMNEAMTKQDRTALDHTVKKMILRVQANKYRSALKNKDVVKIRKRRGKATAQQGKAPVPTGQLAIADPPVLQGNPVGATHLASETPQGGSEDAGAETFNLDVPSDDEDASAETGLLDTTMNEATRLRVNPNSTANDDDGSVFDISQTTGLSLAPQPASTDTPPQQTTCGQLDRSSAPPVAPVCVPTPPTHSSPLLSTAPAGSTCAPAFKLPSKSALATKPRASTPPPPPPPPSPSPSNSAHATATKPTSAGVTCTSLAPSQPAPPANHSSAPKSAPAPSRPPAAKKAPPAAPTTACTAAHMGGPAPSAHTPTTPFGATGPNIVWRGKTITMGEMDKLRSLAVHQATGTKPRISLMYKELVNILAANPDYNPASDPLPAPDPPAPTHARGRKAATSAPAPAPGSVTPSTTPAGAPPPKEKPKGRRKPKMKAAPEPEPKPKPEPEPKPEPKPEPEPEPEPKPVDDNESGLSSAPSQDDSGKDNAGKEPGCTTGKQGASSMQGGSGSKASMGGK
ncbi:hypothetical protein FRC10_005442, partial [Ceratobasidium sp. 414]